MASCVDVAATAGGEEQRQRKERGRYMVVEISHGSHYPSITAR